MKKLGHRPFGSNSLWLVRSCERRYRSAIIDILMGQPELSDIGVGNAMVDYFEPDRLSFDGPVTTELSWTTSKWLIDRDLMDCYIHTARVPYTGTTQLWRLYGSVSGKFRTRLGLSAGTASLKLLLPDRDVEGFRDVVTKELELGQEIAASQDGAISQFRTYLVGSIDNTLKHTSIDHLREEADRLRAIAERSRERAERSNSHL